MGRADDLDEFKDALRPIGIPWVNTIAADRFGDAFYGDISTHPHATEQLRTQAIEQARARLAAAQAELLVAQARLERGRAERNGKANAYRSFLLRAWHD